MRLFESLKNEESTKYENNSERKRFGNKEGLWSLRPFKAPSSDGLHVGFYKQFWGDVGNSVCKEVLDFLSMGKCLNILMRPLLL